MPKLNPMAAAISAAVVSTSLSFAVMAAENPFQAQDLQSGYQVAEGHAEGKCGAKMEKSVEGKCGEEMKKAAEGKCGEEMKKAAEGKCGEGMMHKSDEGKSHESIDTADEMPKD